MHSFHLSSDATGTPSDVALGRALMRSWRVDGAFQLALGPADTKQIARALDAARRFFDHPKDFKAAFANDLSYSGYAGPGERLAGGHPERSESFTVCRDLDHDDARVAAGWPGHGPVPWPCGYFRAEMLDFMTAAGRIAQRILGFISLGLWRPGALPDSGAPEGWHHMRALCVPPHDREAPAEPDVFEPVTGPHSGPGLLVMAVFSGADGYCLRPPAVGERGPRDWPAVDGGPDALRAGAPLEWIETAPHVLTVFPGDTMQFLTGGSVASTAHGIRARERRQYALEYFHEPEFGAAVRPLGDDPGPGRLDYARHFTNLFLRSYPERPTSRRIIVEDRLSALRTGSPEPTGV